MTCEKGHFVPDDTLICRTCVEELDRRARHQAQLEYLRKTVAREYGYTLRVTKGTRHVQMFGVRRTYCGAEMPAKTLIEQLLYSDTALATVCVGCRLAIADLIEEALAK